MSVPELGERYYLMQLVDAWTNVFDAPGTRTTGNGKGDFAIVGPGWKGHAARWLEGGQVAHEHGLDHRPHADERQGRLPGGPRPSSAVPAHAAQRLGRSLCAAWQRAGCEQGCRCEGAAALRAGRPRMKAATFFGRLNTLMRNNSPASADADRRWRAFRAIGVVAGQGVWPRGAGPGHGGGHRKGITAPPARRSMPKPRNCTARSGQRLGGGHREYGSLRDELRVPSDRRPAWAGH